MTRPKYPRGRVYARKPSYGGYASLAPLWIGAAIVALIGWVVRRGRR